MNDLDLIGQITNETMNLGKRSVQLNNSLNSDLTMNDSEITELDYEFRELKEQMLKNKISEKIGLLYFLNISQGTYRIEFCVCENMFKDYYSFKQKLIEKFDSNDNSNFESDHNFEIHSFPVDCIDKAEMIANLLSKKRFPINESSMSNISDPGFSWWMNVNDQSLSSNSLNISFSLQANESGQWENLGILADDFIAMNFLKDINWDKLGLSYCANKNGFSISSSSSSSSPSSDFSLDSSSDTSADTKPNLSPSRNFDLIKSMFQNGSDQVIQKLNSSSDISSNRLFIAEIIETRKFWIDAHKLINKKNSKIQ